MHLNPYPRFLKLALAGSLLATLFGLNFVPAVHAATPTPVCSGNTCTVTFAYSGTSTRWTTPAGITSLAFDVQGAQGGGSGNSGGLGGRVTGKFAAIPTDVYVVVGNKGSNGNGVIGGFNGGGSAGVGDSSVGAGGGASDLRTSSQVSSRFVVAGGGGGGGAGATGEGGSGGHGGALIGQAGGSGLGLGGGGGLASSGGAGGSASPAGGTAGSSGSSATGGNGGSGTLMGFGGGGGGGGYFGGGGGGGDSDAAGLDAGGGGGGSSYANSSVVSEISHTQGYRAGAGQVVLTYTYPPKVASFVAKKPLFAGSAASFDLAFDQAVTGLDVSDFSLTGTATGCAVQVLAFSTSTFEVIANGCVAAVDSGFQGTVGLKLAANSVAGASGSPGPSVEVVSDLAGLDQSVPSVAVSSPSGPTSALSHEFIFEFDEPILGFEASDLLVSGSACQVQSLTNPSLDRRRFVVVIDSCAGDALLTVSIRSGSVSDIAGNLAPVVTMDSTALRIDRLAPAVSNLSARNWRSGEDVVIDVAINEEVTAILPVEEMFEASGAGCQIVNTQANGSTYLITLQGCQDSAEAMVTLAANSFSDLAGNLGPASAESSSPVLIDLSAPTIEFGSITQFTPQTSPSFNFWFSEPVSGFDESDLKVEGSSAECTSQLSTITEGLEYQLETFGCAAGTVVLRVLQNAGTDASGNQGPASDQLSAVATVQAAPVNPPDPEPTPTPTPEPTSTPTPSNSVDPSPSPTPQPSSTQTESPAATPSPSVPRPKHRAQAPRCLLRSAQRPNPSQSQLAPFDLSPCQPRR